MAIGLLQFKSGSTVTAQLAGAIVGASVLVGANGAPPANPVAIFGSNLVFWYNASAGLTTGPGPSFQVSAWADQSGNGNNLVQSTALLQPNYSATGFNGLPGVTFTGSVGNCLLTSNSVTGFNNISAWAFFANASMNAASPAYGRLLSVCPSNEQDFGVNGVAAFLRNGSLNQIQTQASGNAYLASNMPLASGVRLGVTSDGFTLNTYENNVITATDHDYTSMTTPMTVGLGTYMANGVQADTLHGWDGNVREAIGVNIKPSSTQLAQLDAWLLYNGGVSPLQGSGSVIGNSSIIGQLALPAFQSGSVVGSSVIAGNIVGATRTFNGGRSQIQSTDLSVAGDYPWINLLKIGGGWQGISSGQNANPANLDANGYPLVIEGTGITTEIFSPAHGSVNGRPGNYLVRWTGNATIGFGGRTGDVLVSGSKTGSGGSGRYVFSTVSQYFDFQILNLNGSSISNVLICHVNDEALYDANVAAGDASGGFSTQFLNLMKAANPGVIRFMDWFKNNTTNITTWSTRKPITYYSYYADEWRKGAGSLWHTSTHTNNSATDYAITGNGLGVPATGGPTEGMIVQFNPDLLPNVYQNVTYSVTPGSATLTTGTQSFVAGDPVVFFYLLSGFGPGTRTSGGVASFEVPNSQTLYVLSSGLSSTTCQLALTPGGTALIWNYAGSTDGTIVRPNTLNLNGTGARPLLHGFGGAVNYSLNLNQPNGGMTWVYNSKFKAWMVLEDGGGIISGVPPEVAVSLCAQIGAHPHFTAPMYAADTDWHTQLATYVKNNGPSWMCPRFEGPNEQGLNNFWQANFSHYEAPIIYGYPAMGTIGALDVWYARYLSKMGQAVASVYGVSQANVGTQTSYSILCGVNHDQTASIHDPRLKSTLADGFQAANIANGTHPTVTTPMGPHGKNINDPVVFVIFGWCSADYGNILPAPLQNFVTYYVASTNFSTTGFDVSATPGGAAITTTNGGSAGAIGLYAPTMSPAYNWTTTICNTNYWNPTDQDKYQELVGAVYVAVNGPNDPTSVKLLNNYAVRNGVSYGSFTGTLNNGILTLNSNIVNPFDNTLPGYLYPSPASGGFGNALVGVGVPYNTRVTALLTGTAWMQGATYAVNTTQNVGPVTMMAEGLLCTMIDWHEWGKSMPNPVPRVCNYEGGFSMDYHLGFGSAGSYGAWYTPMVSMTATNPAVVTLGSPTSSNYFGSDTNNGHACVVGCYVKLSTTGIAAAFNNLKYKVLSVNGNTVSLQLDATGMGGTYTGGSITYVLNANNNVSEDQFSSDLINNFRFYSKFAAGQTSVLLRMYNDIYTIPGGEYPSCYDLAANSYFLNTPVVSNGGGVWGMWDPDIYTTTPSPQWAGILQFNNP